MNHWIEEMLRQQKENETVLKQIEKDLAHVPEGSLRIAHQKGIARFYQTRSSGKGQEKYLGNDQTSLRDALAQKKYALKAKQAIEAEQKAIQSVIRKGLLSPAEVLATLPEEMKDLVKPYFISDEAYTQQWLENISRHASGEDFKSRVEVIIDNYYGIHDVPRVYEPALYLEGYGPVRPDFAVLNVRTRQMYYHEHFGMMDDEEYRVKNMKKLRAYHNNGFFEGINLIITMESDGGMIDYREIENLIMAYCK